MQANAAIVTISNVDKVWPTAFKFYTVILQYFKPCCLISTVLFCKRIFAGTKKISEMTLF